MNCQCCWAIECCIFECLSDEDADEMMRIDELENIGLWQLIYGTVVPTKKRHKGA